jgi:RNA polymerase-binding transcription factor DksA
MKPWQRDQLQRALDRRREALVEELRGDAARMAAPLQDLDASVAALLSDVGRADLSRDADELRDVEAARQRLADGSYGICVDCGAEIGFERLQAEPAAARCLDCQARHEKTYRR